MPEIVKYDHGGELHHLLPGETANPNGRPRKVLKQMCEELGLKIGAAIPVSDKLQFVNHMLEMTRAEILSIKGDKRSPVWLVTIACAIERDINKGETKVLSELMDRVIGRPQQAQPYQVPPTSPIPAEVARESTRELYIEPEWRDVTDEQKA